MLASCAATIIVISGCGGGASAGAGGTSVRVGESDFRIATSTAHVASGDISLQIHNDGPDEHELIVAPWHKGGLPMRSDGFTVNEEALQNSEPGAIAPQRPGGKEHLRLHLAPGRYVLFCNMEGHYMGGMHTVLVVG